MSAGYHRQGHKTTGPERAVGRPAMSLHQRRDFEPIGIAALSLLGSLTGCEPGSEEPSARNACNDNPNACVVDGAMCSPLGETFSCDCPEGFVAAAT